LREACHWSLTKKLYCQFRVVLRLSSNGIKLFCTEVDRPNRKSAVAFLLPRGLVVVKLKVP
jgi:hypothetical protein